jgi:hypothetical protein
MSRDVNCYATDAPLIRKENVYHVVISPPIVVSAGVPAVLEWFHTWKCHVRLDIFHFMRRFTKGLTTEHHPLYGTFCSKFSSCVFVWDKEDYFKLREAKKGELRRKYKVTPTEKQVTAALTPSELARHCRRRVRDVHEMKTMIDQLLKEMWELTDTTGLRLINPQSMEKVWSVQQRHLPCITDPPGVHLYTKIGTTEKGGKSLDLLKCARGSSSLESFHRHQCTFIPGKFCIIQTYFRYDCLNLFIMLFIHFFFFTSQSTVFCLGFNARFQQCFSHLQADSSPNHCSCVVPVLNTNSVSNCLLSHL